MPWAEFQNCPASWIPYSTRCLVFVKAFLSVLIGTFSLSIGDRQLVYEARWSLLLKEMTPLKLELDLIDPSQKAMIWVVVVKRIMVSIVLVLFLNHLDSFTGLLDNLMVVLACHNP